MCDAHEEVYVDHEAVEAVVRALRSGAVKKAPRVSRRTLVAAEAEGRMAPDAGPDAPALPTYTAMLSTVYTAMQKSRPAAKKKWLHVPTFCRVGGARTGWTNFGAVCAQMKRPCDHVAQFFSVELAMPTIVTTIGLVVRARLDEKAVSLGLKKYVERYVECGGVVDDITGKKTGLRGCRSWNTTLFFDKRLRLQRLQCMDCKGEVTVPTLVEGFRAVTKADRRTQKAVREGP
jgi:translation initiation factor 2 beta subunit (eIF-2beta)/eIF-5